MYLNQEHLKNESPISLPKNLICHNAYVLKIRVSVIMVTTTNYKQQRFLEEDE